MVGGQKLGNHAMKRVALAVVAAFSLCTSSVSFAAGEYNAVPAGDAQYSACLSYSNSKYEGGNEPSLIAGQNKAQAWCTCMWNETPDDFKGSLAKFAETSKGAEMNKLCERYSGWNS